ncbi:hypothetical protein PTT_12568 [Pyrenophora teres f. teres 0-1]|uniref:Uncharacterized protein n=1 Tax=Pyrenophora teres f. teres (strain 0-1) TaxID=861557 RepID=E3RU29_PYRTT|nr:hypothetical protein PTT_12568 [Pyrenophora teres f. teres 0-1]
MPSRQGVVGIFYNAGPQLLAEWDKKAVIAHKKLSLSVSFQVAQFQPHAFSNKVVRDTSVTVVEFMHKGQDRGQVALGFSQAEASKADSFMATSIPSVVAQDSLTLVLDAVVGNALRQVPCPSGEAVWLCTLFSGPILDFEVKLL